ncbi:AAA family ATPase, partial [candidate division WOR-3 bacterium]|nr:AAA family ATPase [candidate division WOR-3 bacterium]
NEDVIRTVFDKIKVFRNWIKKKKIELIKHKSIYALKKPLQKIESQKDNIKRKSISKKFNKQFFPEILNDLSASGEFRKIVPLFFNFSLDLSSEKIRKLVERITYYCNEMNGYFNKIDFTDKGGIILVIFGAPFTSENMIENALLLAIKINEEFPDLNITSGLDYGITYTGFLGSKYWQEYTVLGDIVNTAARIACLETKNINVTNRIKAETSSYEFKFENKLKLKGKNRSVDIHSIVSQKKKELEYFSPFVSRDIEQNRVLSILKNSTKRGKTAVIYIEGESGIGKTRLIYHVLKKIHMKLHYGQSDSVLLEPLFPIKQIFASIIGFNQYDKRKNRLSIIDKYIIKHFPDKSETFLPYLHNLYAVSDEDILKHISAKEIQETTFYILREIIIESAKNTSSVLIFDDIMWSDEDSIDFINYAFHDNIPGITIIAIFREENKIIKRINLKYNKINLTNFSYNGVNEFIKAFFSKKPSKSLLKLLWDKSEGNPLFLEQITIHLTNNDLLIENEKEITLSKKEYDLPSNIDRLIVSRLDSLSAITREGIKKASVFGKEFEILLLQFLIGKKTAVVLSEGERNKIISVISKNLGIFRHTLLYEIAYKMQFENELKKLHKKIGKLYEQYYHDDLTPYYEILYYHYKNAGMKKKTLYYLELAINRYINNYSNDIAIKLIDEYLSMNISIKNRVKALIKLGNVHMHTAEYKKAIKDLRLAIKENTVDKVLNADAYKGLGEINWSLGKYSLALKNYNNAFEIFNEKKIMSGMSKIHELKGLVYYYKGDYDIAYKEFNNALKYVNKDKQLKN